MVVRTSGGVLNDWYFLNELVRKGFGSGVSDEHTQSHIYEDVQNIHLQSFVYVKFGQNPLQYSHYEASHHHRKNAEG